MIGEMDKSIKKMDFWDIGLIKLSTAVFVLFIITIWSAAMDWVHSVNPWYFLVAFIIFVIRPLYRVYMK